MAKKKKKFDFAAFTAELTENASERRVVGNEEERRYFLIVCEGEKTEPNYFNSLVNQLPPDSVEVKVVGEGTNTLNVVNKAIELRNERAESRLLPEFDESWTVFDRDSFPAQRFNEAVMLGQRENIGTAYTNEAFELWYILHFQYLDTGVSRDQYIDILKGILGKYAKNSMDIYKVLQDKGNEELAIRYATRLLDELSTGNPADEKPTTRVHELVMQLNKFKSNS